MVTYEGEQRKDGRFLMQLGKDNVTELKEAVIEMKVPPTSRSEVITLNTNQTVQFIF